MILSLLIMDEEYPGAELEGGVGEVYPAIFQKLKKSALNLGKKCPEFGYLWVKFPI